MPNRAEIEAQLLGPGGPFEIVTENVLGEELQVFENRPRSLRQVLTGAAPDRQVPE